jgi:hypothetical protein
MSNAYADYPLILLLVVVIAVLIFVAITYFVWVYIPMTIFNGLYTLILGRKKNANANRSNINIKNNSKLV